MRRSHDDGQITLLIIGFVMIVVLLVGVIANASKAFVYRRSLASWADGAAVAAAQNVAEDVVFLVEGKSIKHHAEDRGEPRASGAQRSPTIA